jgi:hypothetical protein
MNLRRLTISNLRAAHWAYRALADASSEVNTHGLAYSPPARPPALPAKAYAGVLAALRRRRSTCLERALVVQRWHQAHGDDRDVVVAVQRSTPTFAAHAWVDGATDEDVRPFAELLRLPPR